MTKEPSRDALENSRFQRILVECLEKLERGESLDGEALVREHPQFGESLKEFLADQAMLREVASGVRNSLGRSPVRRPVDPLYDETIDSSPKASSDFSAGETIRYVGEYEILDEIAHGGMGVVFKARQRTLRRIVALKMILAGKLADDADVRRFHREAQAAGSLKHPNIVPVHEIGEHEGRHYFTMDFVDGRSLAEEIREESLPARRAAELVRTAAETVQFAHDQGTVHRDLKPANVLLPADDVPLITDFGLAKMLGSVDEESRAQLTASGQILGTPSYMSPEQASGKQELVGPASDIYSLGAILYACLTSRAPFVADSPVDTLLQVMKKEPVSPRELNPSVPKDLETICLKCLTKEPHKRYGTAQELADDLGRFLEGRPVVARPVGPIRRYYRWCQRNPTVAALIVLVFASMAIGTTIASKFAVDAMRHARRAELQRLHAEAAQRTAEEQKEIADRSRQEAERERKAATAAKAQAEWSFSQEADARMQAELAQRDVVRSLYVARTHLTRLLWERGNEWGASLPHIDQFFNNDLTIANPDPEIELEILSKMISASPSDDFLHFLRGIYYAKRRQWRESLVDLEMSSNLTSQRYWYHCESAAVALMVDDDEAYDRHLLSLLEYVREFEKRGDILSGANVALIAALQPQPPEVLAKLLPFTERWAAPNPQQFFRMKSLILMRMRLGEYEKVLELLEPFSDDTSFNRTEHIVLARSIRALALYHLGRLDEAQREFEIAKRTFDDRLTRDFVVREGSFQATHHPFIQAHVLLREAKSFVENDEPDEQAKATKDPAALPRRVQSLLEQLNSKDSAQRVKALQELADMREDAAIAVPELVRLLEQPDSYEKLSAIRCLGRIGPAAAAAVPQLLEILKSERSLTGPRFEAARAITCMGEAGEVAIPELIAILKDPGDSVKSYLKKVTAPSAQGLMAPLLREDDTGAYTDQRDMILLHVISCLAAFGPAAADAIPEIELLRDDPDTLPAVKEHAVTAIQRIRDTHSPKQCR